MIEYISQIVTPFGIDLPPRTSTDRIDALYAEVKRQAEQLRILGELVEALRGEVEAMRQDAATRTQSDQDDMVAK